DVAHGELVEADHARAGRDFLGHELERILDVAVRLQPLVHGRHEPMEVLAALVFERQRVEEEIHEKCFSAADTAPEIEAAHGSAPFPGELRGLRAPAAM